MENHHPLLDHIITTSNISEYDSDIEASSTIAEYEGTPPSSLESPISVSTPLTITDPLPMATAGPVLSHLAIITRHAEDMMKSMNADMEMTSMGYIKRRAIHKYLNSQIDLHYLNNLLQTVVGYATSTSILGYLDGVNPERLFVACNYVSC
jgi:hypothetical protein